MDHNLNVHHPFFFSLFFLLGMVTYVMCLVFLSFRCLWVVCPELFVCLSVSALIILFVGRGSQGIFTKENPRNAGELGPTSIKAVQQECFYM